MIEGCLGYGFFLELGKVSCCCSEAEALEPDSYMG